ncbi:hypothetical protein K7X08_003836 [Anisodus acutangulus]|uniref:inositol-1,3,4-trisphosphate 5/6-kinase n=1 Tax=Anisodus acutangulus TaxID=402998 RepID=A0A9Q1MGF9_9SOLA|nr:hypothetical protein K7X08_003836 [Anisodus acutangulus]
MLKVVNELNITQENETIGIPIQIFVEESLFSAITRQGLHFPVIAKNLIANGTADSHQMYLVLKPEGLGELKPPVILQEFVNHGGVIFKISNLTDQIDHSFDELIEKAEMPPLSFVNQVANQLRVALQLHLFNFDMIRDNKVGNRYLVIDINYFPGYAKMPNYESMMTAFFLDIAREKQNNESRLASE